MFKFKKKYFFASLLLFLIELGIAFFIEDRFIRPYLGDVFVVILLYTSARSFVNSPPLIAAAGVLGLAFLIELLQLFNIIRMLDLQDNKIARTFLGSHFDWMDLLAYIVGILTVLIFEKYFHKKHLRIVS